MIGSAGFYGISIDYPDGWSANLDEEEYSVVLTAANNEQYKF